MLKNIIFSLTILIPALSHAGVQPISHPSPNSGTITPAAVSASTLTVDTNTLKTVAGKVGIGTASPCSTCTLHVAGGASVTGAFAVGQANFTVTTTGIVNAPSQPAVVLHQSYGQDVRNGLNTQIFWDTAVLNTQNMWNIASSATVTVPATGVYAINCAVVMGGAPNGTAQKLNIYVGGSQVSQTGNRASPNSDISISHAYPMTAGQGVDCRITTDSTGASAKTIATTGYSIFSVVKLW